MQKYFFLGYVWAPLHRTPLKREIYSDNDNVNIELYYKDWKLRGTLQSYSANLGIRINF